MLIYIIKSSIALAVVTSFYWIFLRRLTFYRWNRWYLLGYSMLAFLLPLFNIYDFVGADHPAPSLMEAVPLLDTSLFIKTRPAEDNLIDWADPLVWGNLLLLAGGLFFALRLLINVGSFLRLKKKAILLQDGPVKVFAVNANASHFSFGNAIFINPATHTDSEIQRILQHEYVHARQRHVIDLLWAEVLCLLMWFNPFAWLLRKSIRQNLEFLADEEVLRQGVAPREYQLLLLKVMSGMPHRFVAPFSFSFLKKRIAMMNKNKTARIHTIRFLFVLPLLATIVLSFRSIRETAYEAIIPDQQPVMQPAAPVTQEPELLISADTVPRQKKVPVQETEKVNVVTHLTAPDMKPKPLILVDGVKISGEAKLNDLNPNDIESINVLKDAAALATYGTNEGVILIKTKSGKPLLSEPKPGEVLEIRAVPPVKLQGKVEGMRISEEPIKVKNEVRGVQVSDISKEPVQEVTVVGYAKKKTVEEVVVTGYATKKKPADEVVVTGYATKKKPVEEVTVVGYARPKEVAKVDLDKFDGLLICDGKEYTGEEYKKLNIKPAAIESINVFNKEAALDKYGEKGKNGVIVVTTKKQLIP